MGSTLIDLPADLRAKKTGEKAVDSMLEMMARRAEAGYYHDFLTGLATPKMVLNENLNNMYLEDLAQKVIDGAYDDEAPEDKPILGGK